MTKEYDKYIFNSDGRVFSKSHKKYISCNHGKNWYHKLIINGKRIYVHRLIAELFISNPENKPEVNHKNGIKTDNRIENLEWVTSSENMKHAFNTGLVNPINCQDHPSAKLSNKEVFKIRELISNGVMQKDIAKHYKVNTSTISRINTGQKWKAL